MRSDQSPNQNKSPTYCEDLRTYFADGGLVANNPSYIGLLEVFRDMKFDFPDVTHKVSVCIVIGDALFPHFHRLHSLYLFLRA
ncbi:hypothetical protein B8P98_09845 [Klebsiella quasivariicola]|nr:hypothetical protein B8P98_09845 [Klebsiella quasivariicola]